MASVLGEFSWGAVEPYGSPHIIRGCLGLTAQEKLLLSQKGASLPTSAARGARPLATSIHLCPVHPCSCGVGQSSRMWVPAIGEQGTGMGEGRWPDPLSFLPTGTQSCTEVPAKTPPPGPVGAHCSLWVTCGVAVGGWPLSMSPQCPSPGGPPFPCLSAERAGSGASPGQGEGPLGQR